VIAAIISTTAPIVVSRSGAFVPVVAGGVIDGTHGTRIVIDQAGRMFVTVGIRGVTNPVRNQTGMAGLISVGTVVKITGNQTMRVHRPTDTITPGMTPITMPIIITFSYTGQCQ
jgi:hypothetical protein